MAASNSNYEMFRNGSLGSALTDALDDLIAAGSITPDLALKTLMQFDKSMAEKLQQHVKAKTSIKGHLETYRSVDDVWTFHVTNPTFKLESFEATAPGTGGAGPSGSVKGEGSVKAEGNVKAEANAGVKLEIGGNLAEMITIEKVKIVACKGTILDEKR